MQLYLQGLRIKIWKDFRQTRARNFDQLQAKLIAPQIQGSFIKN
jgi:hypothetical protein